ncbi:MAG: mannitol dehydrogenase family protein, partial [Clostridiaceae bacterium]|nr:mannitol dehydrogenase family protein [Clostridiaceae bacterium]
MNLTDTGLQDRQAWEKAEIAVPTYDRAAMVKRTKENPEWVHFGAGNIFRGFIANLQDALLEAGLAKTGIIAAETFDFDIMDKIYKPFDDLALLITLKADGSTEK